MDSIYRELLNRLRKGGERGFYVKLPRNAQATVQRQLRTRDPERLDSLGTKGEEKLVLKNGEEK